MEKGIRVPRLISVCERSLGSSPTVAAHRCASILGLVHLCSLDDSPNAEIILLLKKAADDLDQVIMDITVLADDLI